MKKFSKMLAASVVSVFVLGLVNFSQSEVKEDQPFAQFQQWAVSHQDRVAGEKLKPLTKMKDTLARILKGKGGTLIIGKELSDKESKEAMNKGLDYIKGLKETEVRAEYSAGKLNVKDSADQDFYRWLTDNKIVEKFTNKDVQKVVIVGSIGGVGAEIAGQAVPKGAVDTVKENTIFLSKNYLIMIAEYSEYGKAAGLAEELAKDLIAESFGEHELEHIVNSKGQESEIEGSKSTNQVKGFFLMRKWSGLIAAATRGLQDLTITTFDSILASLSGKQKPIDVVLRGEEFLDANGEVDPAAIILSLNSFKFLNNRSVKFNVKFSIGEDTVNKIKAQDKEKDIVRDLGNAFKYLAPEMGNKSVNVEVKVVKSGTLQTEINEMINSLKKPDTILAVATKSVLNKNEAEQIAKQGVAISYLEQPPTGEQFVPYAELIMQAVKGALLVQRGETLIAIAVKPLILPENVRASLVRALDEFSRLQKLAIKA